MIKLARLKLRLLGTMDGGVGEALATVAANESNIDTKM